ncbi:MAG: O-antigen ligase family protein [Actinobacteria bacterium]|nr:O-antigen ligase family protein [Actinomycetota bacterium]
MAGALLATGQARLAALLVALCVVLSALALNTQSISVLAVPAVFLVERLDLGGIDLSYSDALLIGATAVALPALSRWPLSPRARLLLLGLTIYLSLVTFTIAFHPSIRSYAEVFHRAILVGGSVIIGVQLVRTGRHVLALRLLLAATVTVSFASIATTLSTGLQPAYPWGLHKNFVGSLFATFLLLAVIHYPVFRLPVWGRLPLVVALSAGLAAAQSRGAFLTLLAGLLILAVRRQGPRRLPVRGAAVLAVCGIAALIIVSVQNQLQERVETGNLQDSLAQREQVETATFDLWRENWVVGVGLKYFTTGAFGAANQAPNNVLNESMAETGVVGTAGFLILQAAAVLALARGSGPLATAGLACVVGRLLHGQVDIYWSAGTAALPWLIAGFGLAEERRRIAGVAEQETHTRV